MKIVFRALVAFVFLVGSAGAALADPDPSFSVPPPLHLGMAAGILVDAASGKVLWSHDADVARPPASLTKILTALVVLDRANLDDSVTVTPEARGIDGARIYAEAGWVMPVRDLPPQPGLQALPCILRRRLGRTAAAQGRAQAFLEVGVVRVAGHLALLHSSSDSSSPRRASALWVWLFTVPGAIPRASAVCCSV